MGESIEIVDMDENVKAVLNQEAQTRENILKLTEQALESQNGNMLAYTKVTSELKKLKEDYLLLKIEKEVLEKQVKRLNDMQKNREGEIISLRFENEENKKKHRALQSLLQVVTNTYGVSEIIAILGISYTKLEEYLKD